MLNYLRQRYVRSRLTAYINGELSGPMRRYIARHIDENPAIYAQYVQQREAKLELERTLPTFGRPDNEQLNRVWLNIQASLNEDHANQSVRPPGAQQRFSWSYGLAVTICIVALLLPLMVVSGTTTVSVVDQPSPNLAVTSSTPARDQKQASATLVAQVALTESQSRNSPTVWLQNTPEPMTPGQ